MPVFSGRIRAARESVGIPLRGTSKGAGLSTDGAGLMAGCPPGRWPQFLSVEIKCLTVLGVYCVSAA